MYDTGITLISNMIENAHSFLSKIDNQLHMLVLLKNNGIEYSIEFFVRLELMFVYSNVYS